MNRWDNLPCSDWLMKSICWAFTILLRCVLCAISFNTQRIEVEHAIGQKPLATFSWRISVLLLMILCCILNHLYNRRTGTAGGTLHREIGEYRAGKTDQAPMVINKKHGKLPQLGLVEAVCTDCESWSTICWIAVVPRTYIVCRSALLVFLWDSRAQLTGKLWEKKGAVAGNFICDTCIIRRYFWSMAESHHQFIGFCWWMFLGISCVLYLLCWNKSKTRSALHLPFCQIGALFLSVIQAFDIRI